MPPVQRTPPLALTMCVCPCASVYVCVGVRVRVRARAPVGHRYHPGVAVVDVASRGSFTYFATDGGVAVIEDQQWTLARKAAHYESVLMRHDRLVGPPGLVGGLVASCSLASFGNYSSCHNADSDNNGLWTSLVVAAEAFRFAVEGSADAQAKAVHFFNGMRVRWRARRCV